MTQTKRYSTSCLAAARWLPWATASCCLLFAANVFAGDYYTSVPVPGFVGLGPLGTGAMTPDTVIGKEYSHTDWYSVYTTGGDPRLVNVDDHNAFGVADPMQVVSWDGKPGRLGANSGSTDAFDYSAGVPSQVVDPGSQVDAIANHGDFLFQQVIANDATLLFSMTGDIGPSALPPPPGPPPGPVVAKDHIHWEDPTGGHATWEPIETAIGAGPGVNHHVVEDLDGLEVWGPEPPKHDIVSGPPDPVVEGYVGGLGGGPNTADADRFSLDLDSVTGTSVWGYDIATGVVAPWISHGAIVAAVESLRLLPGDSYDLVTRNAIDVDAMMAQDVGEIGVFDVGDELLFSIDAIDAPMRDPSSVSGPGLETAITGGEIFHMVATAGGLVTTYLTHGGHIWDSSFDPASAFGYEYKDLDALEAVGVAADYDYTVDPYVPEPASLAMLLLGSVAMFGTARRRA